MSGKKTKQARKQSGVSAKVAGSRPPSTDLAKRRASLQHLDNVYKALAAQQAQLGKKIDAVLGALHQNDVELKGGLDSSEYNLRTHQKALNSIAMDVERLLTAFNSLKGEQVALEHLQMSSVPLPAEEGQEPVVVRRINWAYYHGEVEEDLRILAEIEQKRVMEQQKAQIQKLDAAVKAVAEKAAEEAKAKEEAKPLPEKNAELPEGASVFGG